MSRKRKRILIANRGEIALRVMRTAHEMGFDTIGVFTPDDKDMPHAFPSDRHTAILIDDYLSIRSILKAAQESAASMIHPGYGFLSENPKFASACERAGIGFIGPSARAMRAVGDKAKARATAQRLGIPVAEGLGPFRNAKEIEEAAKKLGAPLMLKAVAGGGGKGMKRLTTLDGLREIIATSQRETQAAFGDDALIVERYVFPARHVEVQVMGDGKRCIALGERECSLQRRHQKIIEESPSPGVDDGLRQRLFESAVALCEAVGYRCAGTVEFLVGDDGCFYFLEVNARLQVEHPVTEMRTGLDLVRMQIEVVQGGSVPKQSDIVFNGHAIEARLNAEDPWKGFLPSAGPILACRFPTGDGLRVDSGIGDRVSARYDSLIAKLIAHGATREEARQRLLSLLKQTVVLGVVTNQPLLIRLLEAEFFKSGETFTHTIDGLDLGERPLPEPLLRAAVAALRGHVPPAPKVWQRAHRGAVRNATLIGLDGRVSVAVEHATTQGDQVFLVRDRERVWAAYEGNVGAFSLPDVSEGEAASEARAPMTGKVVSLPVRVGDRVSEGDTLAILEAMKMEFRLEAQASGVVKEIGAKEGDLVDLGQVLVRLDVE
jgi:acetyl/propionyl-CoA carboxylase alpha subunit